MITYICLGQNKKNICMDNTLQLLKLCFLAKFLLLHFHCGVEILNRHENQRTNGLVSHLRLFVLSKLMVTVLKNQTYGSRYSLKKTLVYIFYSNFGMEFCFN